MGGLICRCYLQHLQIPNLHGNNAPIFERRAVDKLFTYATPHRGITFRKGLGGVAKIRDLLDVNNSGNFDPKRMRDYLSLGDDKPLHSIGDQFPAEKVFCLVGTDSKDYKAAAGLSSASVGPMSDGLVQIENAYVDEASRAYVHRSHSGHYGIVNSEEGYQNLQRFLFGDKRIKLKLKMREIDLGPVKDKIKSDNAELKASYHIETVVAIRGIKTKVHQRTTDTESAIFKTHEDLLNKEIVLFTTYLDSEKKTSDAHPGLGFSIRLRIIPQYHVNKKGWLDEHFEGHAIFDDTLILEISAESKGDTILDYHWLASGISSPNEDNVEKGRGSAQATTIAIPSLRGAGLTGEIGIEVEPWK